VIHPVSGPDIADGTLLIDGDRISAVGPAVAIPHGTPIVDLKGLHLYPGLIDAGSALGVIEINKVHETQDTTEGGLFQPDLRTGIAVNPDSELIPVARAGGITTALVCPQGAVIAGQCSLLQLGGWTVPEMVLNFDLGLVINWPAGKEGATRVRQLREFLEAGRAYLLQKAAAEKNPSLAGVIDPRFEALAPYLRGEKKVFIDADSRQSILAALQFADRERLKIVLVGAVDAWKVASELKKREVPVIVGPVMRAPLESYDPADAPYANAGRLHAAGVLICFRSDHAANSRNTPFDAALAVAHGLPEDEGLKAITWNAAKILGVDNRLGTLTVGKRADLVITDGSPLQPSTLIKSVFIAGKPYRPESKQSRLYERYREHLREIQATKKP
jgi:imidazolonepropionase-like amidohydrolase